ncbi:glycosyltransferase family 4 protein [soil metagenome]
MMHNAPREDGTPSGGERRRLLVLSQTLPYPPDGGVQLRTFNVLRLLAREFRVTALCCYRRSTHPSIARATEAVEAICRTTGAEVEAFPIPQEHSRMRWIRDHATSVLRARPYTVPAYQSAAFERRLHQLLRTRDFDLVHLDSLDLSGYLPLPPESPPVVCAHHNVESILLRRRADSHSSALVRGYFRLQARLLEREERRWASAVALNTAVSPGDRDELLRIAPLARCIVVPNGVDTDYFAPARRTAGEGIVFVGGYGWHPNRDALEYFCTSILPLLRSKGCDAPVRWAGRAPDQVRREYADRYDIELTGYLPDIRPMVQEAHCFVAPLRIGGGTRLKILDAWAMGKAVVSTSIGCEGLAIRDGENIIVRDTPESFAQAVCTVLQDGPLRTRLGAAARRTAETLYNWDIIGSAMIRHYHSVMQQVGVRSPEH